DRIEACPSYHLLLGTCHGFSLAQKILIVEDDDVARELLCQTLARQGYDVTMAEDGVKGYELALSLRPDLIITDIYMPAADGAHLLRHIRDTGTLAATPVIVVTGYGT